MTKLSARAEPVQPEPLDGNAAAALAFTPLSFPCGRVMKNRFMLAPLTNLQSGADGRLSEDELHWLTLRAKGGFGLTMTCAAHVQRIGQGFAGQLGTFGEEHLPGLTRLAAAIAAEGSLSMVQLHHAGMRSPTDLIGEPPVAPSPDAETGARPLSLGEVEALIEDFVAAAERCERAGFDGVEIHGAHGYVISQFLSPELNRREDRYGGDPTNRARMLWEIVKGVRARCRPEFILGVRLSPERFGLRLEEIRSLSEALMASGSIDFLDLSLWDVGKTPEEEAFKTQDLLSWFTSLKRGGARLGAAGKISTAERVVHCLASGCDFVLIGRGAILHHDFPRLMQADPDFRSIALPVSRSHLRREGLGPAFLDYMASWKGFVAPED
jgi:2,4-dienoyl-CoA reductase-like NADH-dependent reductase (Old Yellow Enzyme family)